MKALRNGKTPRVRSVRPMTKDDIESLRQPSARTRVEKLSANHRQMARLLSLGYSVKETAAALGMTPTRVSSVKNSPAFQELMDRFMVRADEAVTEKLDLVNELFTQNMVKALCLQADALDAAEDNPVAMRDLQKVIDSGADRLGYHRKSTKENINIDFAARLEAAIKTTRQIRTIEIEADQ